LRGSFQAAVGIRALCVFPSAASVSTTPLFSLFCYFFLSSCLARVFQREISRQDRPGTTIGNSLDPQHPSFCPFSSAFRFPKVDRRWRPIAQMMPKNDKALIRKSAGLTQVRLAKLAGISQSRISSWENGNTELVPEDVVKIATVIRQRFARAKVRTRSFRAIKLRSAVQNQSVGPKSGSATRNE
jgi:DNA-binding XRE family transcriptional regulator